MDQKIVSVGRDRDRGIATERGFCFLDYRFDIEDDDGLEALHSEQRVLHSFDHDILSSKI